MYERFFLLRVIVITDNIHFKYLVVGKSVFVGKDIMYFWVSSVDIAAGDNIVSLIIRTFYIYFIYCMQNVWSVIEETFIVFYRYEKPQEVVLIIIYTIQSVMGIAQRMFNLYFINSHFSFKAYGSICDSVMCCSFCEFVHYATSKCSLLAVAYFAHFSFALIL